MSGTRPEVDIPPAGSVARISTVKRIAKVFLPTQELSWNSRLLAGVVAIQAAFGIIDQMRLSPLKSEAGVTPSLVLKSTPVL